MNETQRNNPDSYIVSHDTHPITKEMKNMEAEVSVPSAAQMFKDGTQTMYQFPDDKKVSVVCFPHQYDMTGWIYEVMETYPGNADDPERANTPEEVEEILMQFIP